MHLFRYIFAMFAYAALPSDISAQISKLSLAPEALFYATGVTADVRSILHMNGPDVGRCWVSQVLKLANPQSQMSPEWIAASTGLSANGQPVGNESGNQSTHADRGSQPSKEFSETHKLLIGVASLVIGFGVASLAIQWCKWDLVRRIFHKLKDKMP